MTLNHVYAPVTDDNFTTAELNETKHWSLIVHLLNKMRLFMRKCFEWNNDEKHDTAKLTILSLY